MRGCIEHERKCDRRPSRKRPKEMAFTNVGTERCLPQCIAADMALLVTEMPGQRSGSNRCMALCASKDSPKLSKALSTRSKPRNHKTSNCVSLMFACMGVILTFGLNAEAVLAAT